MKILSVRNATLEILLLSVWCKEDRGVYQIVGMLADGVIVAGFEKKKTWEELFNEFEFLNKEPCGKIAYTQKSQQ